MAQTQFRVPANGQVQALTYSGRMKPVAHLPDDHPLYLQAENGDVVFTVISNGGAGREHRFQVVGSGEEAPPQSRFIETVLAPTTELRWWHLFELEG